MSPAIAYKAYQSAQIETLSPRELLVQLFKGMEKFLAHAALAMDNRDIEAAHNNCQKVKAILSELMATLNFERGGDVAQQLYALYAFCHSQVVEANMKKDPKILREVLAIIAPLTQAWVEIPPQFANETSLAGPARSNMLSMRV